MPNNKHLTLDDRIIIEQGLNSNLSLVSISSKINKDPTTISKEIRLNRTLKQANNFNGKNMCKHISSCHLKDICNSNCFIECKTCELCNEHCKNFSMILCHNITKFPYTCNACPKKSSCRLQKFYYHATNSYRSYKTRLSESRQGISLDEEQLCDIDNIVSPLIKQGQSIAHIYATQNINCSKSSLYNYIEKNYLSVCNLDLARKVRFRRRKHYTHKSKDTSIRVNRTYQDFLSYTQDNPDISIVEMDTVEGTKGGKVLLTLFFRNTKLMLAFIMNDKSANSVTNIFNILEQSLGNELFKKTFPIILTDNGTEFSNPDALEANDTGINRTKIFYCDPSASFQKGSIEKNHEFIRYVIPKGISMNNYTQDDILLMINHINSLARNSLNWATPYDLSTLLLGKTVLKKFNLTKVNASEIKLTPNLLKKN